ncbi:MAG: M14 family zinc carboxypeptidase [Chloroflexota bacterium]
MRFIQNHLVQCSLFVVAYLLLTTNLANASVYPSLVPDDDVLIAEAQLTAPNDQLPVVASLSFVDLPDLYRLTAELDVWEVDHPTQRIVALIQPAEQQALKAQGYTLDIDLDRTFHLWALPSNIERARNSRTSNQEGTIPGYACYRTVEKTHSDMAQLAIDYPDLVEWFVIGESWEKINAESHDDVEGPGFDIYALRITDKTFETPVEKPKLFILSEVHARELVTSEIVARFAERLVAQYGKDPDITWLLQYNEVHMIPVANPDGRKEAEKGLWWRKNKNRTGCASDRPFTSYYGVDINRNGSFKWNECASSGCSTSNVCRDTYRGTAPASEPETQAYETYVRELYEDRRGPNDDDPAPDNISGVFLTLHSYSELVIFPWGWTTQPPPNYDQLTTLGRKFGYYTNYETCQVGEQSCLYLADGTGDDWAYGELGLPAYTFELGRNFFERCSYFENNIIPGNMDSYLYALKAARLPFQTSKGPEIVDVSLDRATITQGDPIILQAVADDGRYYSGGHGDEGVQPIVAAHYTIDTPSWLVSGITDTMPMTDTMPITDTTLATMTVPLSSTRSAPWAMTASDGLFDTSRETISATIDTSNLSVGQHLIFVEGQDADGNWGVPTAISVTVLSAELSMPEESDTELEEPSSDPETPEQKPTVSPAYAMMATTAFTTQQNYAGHSVQYTIIITNQSNVTASFQISLDVEARGTITYTAIYTETLVPDKTTVSTVTEQINQATWVITAPVGLGHVGPLSPTERTGVTLTVSIPSMAQRDDTQVITMTIRLNDEQAVHQQIQLITEIQEYLYYFPFIAKQEDQ